MGRRAAYWHYWGCHYRATPRSGFDSASSSGAGAASPAGGSFAASRPLSGSLTVFLFAVLTKVGLGICVRKGRRQASATNQMVFDDRDHKLGEMTEEMVRDKAEQFVLGLTAGSYSDNNLAMRVPTVTGSGTRHLGRASIWGYARHPSIYLSCRRFRLWHPAD